MLTERAVARPVRLVEGAASGVYRPVHVGLRRVRDLPQRLLCGGGDVRERAGLAIDELAVDQHPRLETNLRYRHAAGPLQTGSCRWLVGDALAGGRRAP